MTFSTISALSPLDGRYATKLATLRPLMSEQGYMHRRMLKIHAAVKAMSTGLGDKPFCTGIHLTLADVAVGCALGYLDFRFPQIDWRSDHPNLQRLLEKLAQRPSFADTQPA